jgi:hypothetical protein
MSRKQFKESKLLELSMNTQCILINTKEKQQIREIIDFQDDLRRKEFRKNIKEIILDIFEALENNDVFQAKKKLIKLEIFLNNEFEKEDYFEILDDENRINILDYLSKKENQIRENNFEIENELINRK